MDRIFLSYHFAPRSDVVPLVADIVESHGLHVDDGVDLGGGTLTAEIRRRIQSAGALVSVFTPDEELLRGGFRSAPWVESEFQYAKDIDKRAIAVAVDGVAVAGMYSADEMIILNSAAPIDAFLKLNRIVGLWVREAGRTVRVRLEAETIADVLEEDLTTCSYRLQERGEIQGWAIAAIIREPGGYFIFVPSVREGHSVQVRLTTRRGVWESAFTPQHMVTVLEPR